MTAEWKETLLTLADIFASLLLVAYGMMIGHQSRHSMWFGALLCSAIASFLIASTAVRNHAARKLIEVSKQLILMQKRLIGDADILNLRERNAKLTDVALSAVALMVTIEHGMTPDLHALKRDLAAAGQLRAEDKPNSAAKP
jgi:hypothetical protein